MNSMDMLYLYSDEKNKEIVNADEIDHMNAYPGRYSLLYCFKDDNNDGFITETWYTDSGEYVNIYSDPYDYRIVEKREEYGYELKHKLLYLVKVKMPYHFYLEMFN